MLGCIQTLYQQVHETHLEEPRTQNKLVLIELTAFDGDAEH